MNELASSISIIIIVVALVYFFSLKKRLSCKNTQVCLRKFEWSSVTVSGQVFFDVIYKNSRSDKISECAMDFVFVLSLFVCAIGFEYVYLRDFYIFVSLSASGTHFELQLQHFSSILTQNENESFRRVARPF